MSLPHESESGIASSDRTVFNAPPSSVSFIYPDNKPKPKPPGVSTPTADAYGGYLSSMALLLGLSKNSQLQLSDQSASISQSGEPTGVGGVVFLIGGPHVNSVSHFYNASAPLGLILRVTPGDYSLTINGTSVTASRITSFELGTTDVFTIERFRDAEGRAVFAAFAYGWQGTFAGIQYFKFKMYPRIWTYTDDIYVFRWSKVGSGPPSAEDNFQLIVGTVHTSGLEAVLIGVGSVAVIGAIVVFIWSRRSATKTYRPLTKSKR